MEQQTDFFRCEGDVNTTEARRKWDAGHRDPATRDLLAEDARYFLHQSMSTPCLDALWACEGPWLETLEGKRVLDFHGNNVHQLGFGNSYVISKVLEQMRTLPFSSRRYTNRPAVELAKKLASLLPGSLNRSLFAPGGTSAVGMAVKLARAVTGKHKVVSCWDSFHGASLDAISVGGEAVFRKGMGPMMPGVERVPPPVTYRGPFANHPKGDEASADYLEYVLEKEGEVGAFIAETVRNTDVQIPSEAYWRRVRDICDRHGVLLILDEIPIALGRTGHMFAFEKYGIEPDILCLGKGLGGGLWPMAAMVARDEYNVVADVSLGHYTHEKSPLGATAALAVFDFMEKESLLDKVREDEAYVLGRLLSMKEKYGMIGDVRGAGLLWGIELVKNKITKEKATGEAERIMYRCLENGLSFKVSQGNVLQLSPALTITRDELALALDLLEDAFLLVKSPE
ncbi:aspartate aminotransferase family protein [Fulvitalea axinellae]|uniref:aspartate aminotransferase family protein n=1 Tax=Fulvitalea axinellae TaxID=1182444 RepID=UPI0030CA3D6C